QRAKKVLVAAGGGLQLAAGIAAEQFAVERGEAEHGGVLFVAEQKEGLLQALEQVAVAIAGEATLGEVAQAGDAVPVGVDALAGGVLVVRHEQQAALLGDHEEQEPVNEAQQLAVVLGLVHAAGGERLAQLRAVGVSEKAAAEREQRLVHALAQALAHAAALGDALLVVALEPGLVRVGRASGQAAAMGEPEQDDELAVEVARDHRLEI